MKNVRDYNVGKSDYAKHKIQPWDIILEYGLNYWDGDIIKRVLRTKEGESRRLDYEKIIHICQERIRQIDINEPCYQGEQEDRDETTVFCPSEADKPTYFRYRLAFGVYAVFKSRNLWYAYVGYNANRSAHMYIDLTGSSFVSSVDDDFPTPVILVSDPLGFEKHTSSVKIGRIGTLYETYDYLINDNMLYRYIGLSKDGKLYRYAKFTGGNDIDFVEVKTKLKNYARQVVCEK